MAISTSRALAALAGLLLLGSCQGMGRVGYLSGTRIYTLSSAQMQGNPSTILYQVDVDTAAKAALVSQRGVNYEEPKVLYLWIGLRWAGSGDKRDMHAIAKLDLVPGTSHYSGSFDLLEHVSTGDRNDTNFHWLDASSWFSATNGSGAMTGYALLASEGWYSNNGSKVLFEVEGPDPQTMVYCEFPENAAKGPGLSNAIEYPPSGKAWVPIVYRPARSLTIEGGQS
ncbi:MAG: hypothetical protein ACOYM2_14230 [Rectinemataceae bacterium]